MTRTSDIINTAKKYLGVPYKYGGTSTKGFDCSGFVFYVFNENGIKLNRTSQTLFNQGTTVNSIDDLKEGDLVFFSETRSASKITHVGITDGKGNIIHAATNYGVSTTKLTNSYWKPRYVGARRIIGKVAQDKPSVSESNKPTKPSIYKVGSFQKDVVTTDDLNVRSGRGSEFMKLGSFHKGTKVNVWYIDKSKDGGLWGSCSINGKTGYINMAYTKQ